MAKPGYCLSLRLALCILAVSWTAQAHTHVGQKHKCVRNCCDIWCCSYRHQKSIVATLKDADISIRRRGLDLLFTMCNNQNVRDIVDELLKYLEIADFTMRDELVLKTAVLAERYCLPIPICTVFTASLPFPVLAVGQGLQLSSVDFDSDVNVTNGTSMIEVSVPDDVVAQPSAASAQLFTTQLSAVFSRASDVTALDHYKKEPCLRPPGCVSCHCFMC